MRRIVSLALLAASTGCAGVIHDAFFPANPIRTVEELALYNRNAACTSFNLHTTGGLTDPARIEACAYRGVPGSIDNDYSTPVLVLNFEDDGWQLSNAGNWHLLVTGPDGAELHNGVLPNQVPEVGICTSSGCEKWSIAVVRMPQQWTSGTYNFRLTCTFQSAWVADMALTFAPFAQGWTAQDDSEFVGTCRKSRPASVCDCLLNGFKAAGYARPLDLNIEFNRVKNPVNPDSEAARERIRKVQGECGVVPAST